jgi:hypothetical protein
MARWMASSFVDIQRLVLWILACTTVGVGHVDVVDVASLDDVDIPVLDVLVVTTLISIDIVVIILTLVFAVVFFAVRALPVEEVHVAKISGSTTWVELLRAKGDPVVQDDEECRVVAQI